MKLPARRNGWGKNSEPFVWISKQDRQQPVASWTNGKLTCRYGYSPSSESSSYKEPGQDFGAVAVEEETVRFVLCDGVSLSYRGDYGAKVLGEGLFDWLNEFPGMELVPALRLLEELSEKAAHGLRQLELPEGLPPLVRDVLLEKRSQGTSAMFVCGYLTRPVRGRSGKLWLMWQGDLRIRYWRNGEEHRVFPAESFRTEERWTSRISKERISRDKSAAEVPHLFSLSLPAEESGGVLIYTDGLNKLDDFGLPLTERKLKEALTGGAAGLLEDDASLLEFSWGGPSKKPKPTKGRKKSLGQKESK